jgi:hypothetical protein
VAFLLSYNQFILKIIALSSLHSMSIQKSFFSILIILIGPYAFAQKTKVASSIKVPVQINWAKGETSYLQISELDETVASDEYSKILVESDVRLKVLDRTDTSYTLEWTYTKVKATVLEFELRGAILRMGRQEDLKNIINQMLVSSEECATGMRVVYTTDEFGAFQDIINRDELREKFKSSFKNMLKGVTAEMPAEKRDSLNTFFDFMSEAIVSDADFGITFDDIQLLHQAYGYEYEVGQTLKTEGTWPSPINDSSYPIDVQLKMHNYDSGKKKVVLTGSTTIGKASIKMYLDDLASMLKSKYGIDATKEDIAYEVQSNFDITIDLNYGWIYDAKMVTYQKKNHDISTNTMTIKLRL